MEFKIEFLVVLYIVLLVKQGFCDDLSEYIDLTIEEFIEKFGYPVESHEVTTEDGFTLTIFRIPHGKARKGINKKPILMMHGLFGQADNFILNAVNNASLAFLMADNGYDVWLGNTRGNEYGLKHKELDPSDTEFWNFSYHDISLNDLPATIDYILQKTKKKKLQYIGHSQGGTIFFVLTSLKPEYQKKISLSSLLAPAGYMGQNKFYKRVLVVKYHKFTEMLLRLSNIVEVPTFSEFTSKGCNNSITLLRDICELSWHLLWGGNSREVKQEMLPLILKRTPSVATKQMLHFGQGMASGHFRPYDYGKTQNIKVYGKEVPDDYPIEKIAVPVAIYYSLADNLVPYEDEEEVCATIQNCVRKFLMSSGKWTHLDFLFAINLQKELNEPLLELALKYDE
ncbi:hypothetical protein HHI36_019425 [Cryptolaemus montrouzieri]|uniref:Lipase n=1 Tax=Cryptolaemus montrouzieri TaxID=559131 RepID=A0ABD2P2V7_9CUCU